MAGQGPPAKRRHLASNNVQQHEDHTHTNGHRRPAACETMYAGPYISDGARLSYADLNQASPPQDPGSNAAPLTPVIRTAIVNPTVQQARLVLSPGVSEDEDVPPIFLMRASTAAAAAATSMVERAYAILPNKEPIQLRHGDPSFPREWGCVYCGIAYQRDHLKNDDAADVLPIITFRVPNLDDETVLAKATPDEPIFVAIKKVDKHAVAHAFLKNGVNDVLREDAYGENPYKEIARLQEMGDNRHVIKCLDALQDDDFLYIITPWAMGGDLKAWIWNANSGYFDKDTMLWTPASPPSPSPSRSSCAMIGTCFCHLVDIVAYLERFHIHHRDLSPDNFLFLDAERTILVAMDLAMSVRIPTIPVNGFNVNNGVSNTSTTAQTNNVSQCEEEPQLQLQRQQRTLIKPIGTFGTMGWMAPEIFWKFPFDGVGCDLWSVMIILYNLLTRQILYQYPHTADISFRYFVYAGGLTYNRINERTIQIQMEVFNDDNGGSGSDSMDAATFAQRKLNQTTLLTKSQCHVEFSRDVRELFHHFFRAPPTERWTLAQVMESSYVQQHRRRLQQEQQQNQQQR
jgi:serine/threonine protein kinase